MQAPHVVTVGLPEVVPEYLEVGNLKITTPDPPAFPGANGPPTEGKFPEPPPPPPPVFAVPAVAAIPEKPGLPQVAPFPPPPWPPIPTVLSPAPAPPPA